MEESDYPLDHFEHHHNKLAEEKLHRFECFLIPFLSQFFLGLISFAAFEPASPLYSAEMKIRRDSSALALPLTLEKCSNFNTGDISDSSVASTSSSSSNDCNVLEQPEADETAYHPGDFERHVILGEGQFGQVWLVSERKAANKTAYALKVHSKYDLISQGEVENVIQEKETMQKLKHHPFIVTMQASFQDEHLVYMLQEFCQGGELFSVMHNSVNDSLPEQQAAFYTLCLADALSFMHTKIKLVYRDLKPENVMIDAQGYPKLIDMGYAKVLTRENDYKTFTFVGTPRYLAPETIASAGSSFGVDHWALGILVYEMLTGENPFYFDDLDESTLFQSIADDRYPALPETVSTDAAHFIAGLLSKDPSQRLGSRSEFDILHHAWFQSLDLAAMRREQITAPWVPKIKDTPKSRIPWTQAALTIGTSCKTV